MALAEPVDNAQTGMTAVEIDQRFFALEMSVTDLATANVVNGLGEPKVFASRDAPVNYSSEISMDGGDMLDQASLLIVSGLLADNIAGASLDRWIDLLQGLADQGVAIPDLPQLRMAAVPSPKRSLHLIQTAHYLVPEMTLALNQASDDAGSLEQTGAKLAQLISLREIGDGATDRNAAALRAFEIALPLQDLEGAILAASQWSGPDVPLLTQWMAAAQSRQALDRVVSALVTNRLASSIVLQ